MAGIPGLAMFGALGGMMGNILGTGGKDDDKKKKKKLLGNSNVGLE